MKRLMVKRLTLVCVLMWCGRVQASKMSFDVQWKSKKPTLGVEYEIVVVVSHDSRILPSIETPKNKVNGAFYFKRVSQKRIGEESGESKTKFFLRYLPLSLGEQKLSNIVFRAKGNNKEWSQELELPVLDIVGPISSEDTLPAPKEFSVPMATTSRSSWPWFVIAGALGAILFAVVTLLRKRKRRLASFSEAMDLKQDIDPWGRALRELRLAEHSYLQESTLKKFYMSVSEALRRFLGLRYDYSTLDLTTAELCRSLKEKIIDAQTLAVIQQWLQTCDLVKYAKRQSDVEDAKHLAVEIERWIEASRPAVQEEA